MRVSESSRLRRDDQVARQCQFQAARERQSVDCCDDGLAHPRDEVEHAANSTHECQEPISINLVTPSQQFLEITAGAENAVAAGDDDDANGRIGIDLGHLYLKRLDQRSVEGVHGIRAIERQPGNVAIDLPKHASR